MWSLLRHLNFDKTVEIWFEFTTDYIVISKHIYMWQLLTTIPFHLLDFLGLLEILPANTQTTLVAQCIAS